MQCKYSPAEENYLKTIFHLQQAEDGVSTGNLSAALHTRPASVTDMLKKLKEKKLVTYTPYKKFRLTQKGKNIALHIIRRHRLWEYFLAETLHFSWDEVHDLAEELEHVSSDKLIDKLDAFLSFPRFDPHGDPIPDQHGNLKERPQIMLADVGPDTPVHVVAVASRDLQLLELLQHVGIGIGTTIEVKKKFDFDGTMEVKVNHKKIIQLSDHSVKSIFVKID